MRSNFHEACHIYIIVRSNIAALRSTRLSQGKVFRHFGHIYFDCLLNRKEYGHTYKWHFQIKHFASLLDFELFCCTGAASYYNSAIGLSNRPYLFFAAWALCQCLLHALCVALRSSSLYMYFFQVPHPVDLNSVRVAVMLTAVEVTRSDVRPHLSLWSIRVFVGGWTRSSALLFGSTNIHRFAKGF